MKIIKILFISTLVLLVSSCSKDSDSNDNDISGDLVATWIGTAVDYTGSTVTVGNGMNITSDFVGTGYDIDYSITFSENPNQITSEGNYSIELVTTTEGQTTTQNFENLSWSNQGEWAKNGNTLTITQSGQTQDYQITELTDTNLTIEFDYESSQSAGGITVTQTIHTVAKYTKQ